MRIFSSLAAVVLGAMIVTSAQAQTALIPQDVLDHLTRLSGSAGASHCSRPGNVGAYAGRTPPSRVAGYNSRMDNRGSVEGADTLDRFVADIGQAAAYAVVSRDAATRGQMLDALSAWARAGAFTKTRSCTRNGQLDSACTEWTRDDGTDLSAMKDFSAVQMGMSSVQRAYWLAAANHQTAERAADHQAIRDWFGVFNARMKKPSDVYFGLQVGWYWPGIDAAMATGKQGQAASLAGKLGSGLKRLMLEDGSLKDRTTRGDRALWYHNSALNEIVHSMEIMRAMGKSVPADMENRLHLAVNLFTRAVADPAAIDPWAKEAKNARYTPGRQDWDRDWQSSTWGGSWWHIYAYRYPDRAEAQWLRQSVSAKARSASVDEEVGIGLGCIYNAARAGRGN